MARASETGTDQRRQARDGGREMADEGGPENGGREMPVRGKEREREREGEVRGEGEGEERVRDGARHLAAPPSLARCLSPCRRGPCRLTYDRP